MHNNTYTDMLAQITSLTRNNFNIVANMYIYIQSMGFEAKEKNPTSSLMSDVSSSTVKYHLLPKNLENTV